MRRDEFGFDPEERFAWDKWRQELVDNATAAADKGEVEATDDAGN